MVSLEELLTLLVKKEGSDLHITAGSPPRIRVDGELLTTKYDVLTPSDTQRLVYGILDTHQVVRFEKEKELDMCFEITNLGRFRTNVFLQRGAVGAVIRLIPARIRGFEELGLPRAICEEICSLPKGLVLITGATGSGKTTTLAAMIDYINTIRREHIVTIEDPIEYVHKNKNCLVNQREVGMDTHDFKNALRTVLRQDPDIVLIGEMRDTETMEAALTISETGHLTFTTLHTNDVVQTVNRIIDIFPAHQQPQIRTQLSFTLQAVFCQQLLPRADGKGMVLALEVMLVTPAIRSLIRENKAHQIYSVIQTSGKLGMKTMNQALYELYRKGLITYETAISATLDPDDLNRLLQRG